MQKSELFCWNRIDGNSSIIYVIPDHACANSCRAVWVSNVECEAVWRKDSGDSLQADRSRGILTTAGLSPTGIFSRVAYTF